MRVHFLVDLRLQHILLVAYHLLFDALVRRHHDEVMAAHRSGTASSHLILLPLLLLLWQKMTVRWRHQVSQTLFIFFSLSLIWLLFRLLLCIIRVETLVGLAVHAILHELHELRGLHVLEGAVLALADEPEKDFFEGILFALLVS